VALSSFTEAALADADVLRLLDRIRVVHDPALETLVPRMCPHRVTITLGDGRTFSALSECPPGWASPVPRHIVDAKFLEHCAAHFGAERARETLAAIRRLPDCADMRRFMSTLKTEGTGNDGR